LELAPQRPPTLHNDIGWLSDEAGWTYYYSWTRMSATGTIRVDETVSEVDGSAWMDHQWGDFDVARYPAGWQWFAVQFDDGSDLMLTASRDETLMPIALYGTFVHPDGTTVSLTEAEHLIEIEETDMWTSPHTGGEYPAGWKVTIDALDLELNMTALVADQEIASAQFIPIKYWEGKVSVSGTRNGDVISGDAYAELTGYAPN
jgi:predicted secreted hydrolase